MGRSKAERTRDRGDLLLAIDELGPRANTQALALAMDTTYARVEVDLRAMVRGGLIAQVYVEAFGWLWARADSHDADVQADVDDISRQLRSWEVAQ